MSRYVSHHPTIGDLISNKYLEVIEVEIPKKGHLPTPGQWQECKVLSIQIRRSYGYNIGSSFPGFRALFPVAFESIASHDHIILSPGSGSLGDLWDLWLLLHLHHLGQQWRKNQTRSQAWSITHCGDDGGIHKFPAEPRDDVENPRGFPFRTYMI